MIKAGYVALPSSSPGGPGASGSPDGPPTVPPMDRRPGQMSALSGRRRTRRGRRAAVDRLECFRKLVDCGLPPCQKWQAGRRVFQDCGGGVRVLCLTGAHCPRRAVVLAVRGPNCARRRGPARLLARRALPRAIRSRKDRRVGPAYSTRGRLYSNFDSQGAVVPGSCLSARRRGRQEMAKTGRPSPPGAPGEEEPVW